MASSTNWLAMLLEKNSGDPRKRLELGELLLDKVRNNRLPADSAMLNDFCDLCVQWISASNYKVALLAFDLLELSVQVSGDIVALYILERSSAFIERLGDSKSSVREAASALLYRLAFAPHSSPQTVLDRVAPGFSHRQWLVRTGSCSVFTSILEESREAVEAHTMRLVPTLCKLLADPNAEVRDMAAKTLAHVIAVLGPKAETNIRNKGLIPEAKLNLLSVRAREVALKTVSQRLSSTLQDKHVPTASSSTTNYGHSFSRSSARSSFRSPPVRSPLSMFKEPRLPNGRHEEEQENREGMAARPTPVRRAPSATPLKAAGGAGALNEDDFRKSFDQVPKVTVFTARDVQDKMSQARSIMQDDKQDWSKRVTALKTVRAVWLNGGRDFEDTFLQEVSSSEEALLVSVKDLRSQVCREACLTVSFLSQELGGSFLRVAESILPATIQLILNSAKIMSSSGMLATAFISKNVSHPKLVPILLAGLTHKAKEIRRETQAFVCVILDWPVHKIEKSVPQLCEAIKQGLGDADPGARTNARQGFAKLETVFPKSAEMLFKTLDPSKQRALQGSVSQSSSTQSIVSEKDSFALNHRPGQFGLQKQKAYYTGRSTSEIDPAAARRAQLTPSSRRIPISSGMSAARKLITPTRMGLPPSGARSGRSSQPGSRTGSPENRPLTLKSITPTKLNGTANRCDTAAVTDAIRAAGSFQANEKREGLSALKGMLLSGAKLESHYIKKVQDVVLKAMADSNHKLVQPTLELLEALIAVHAAELGDWLSPLLYRLLQKTGNEIIPMTQKLLQSSLATVRASFDAQLQLQAICGILKNPAQSSFSPKVKEAFLRYLHDLIEASADRQLSINNEEVRGALGKLLSWIEDPRVTPALREACNSLISSLFRANEGEFSSLVDGLPAQSREYVRALCMNRDARSASVRDDINQVTAQISQFVLSSDSRQRSPLVPLPKTGYGTPPPIAPKPQSIPIRFSPSVASDTTDGSFMGGPDSATMHLASDFHQQDAYIEQCIRHMSDSSRPDDQKRSLASLSQMVSEGSFTLWDKHFNALYLATLSVISEPEAVEHSRRNALKLLSKMCTAQASRFYRYGAMSVLKVLDAHSSGEGDSQIQHAAEECAKILATHLPSQMVVACVNPIVKEKGNVHQTLALKMLTRLFESLESDELQTYLGDVVPPIINTYIDETPPSSSAARKSALFALVSLHNRLGSEPLAQFVENMDPRRLKLMQLYIQRSQTASNHF